MKTEQSSTPEDTQQHPAPVPIDLPDGQPTAPAIEPPRDTHDPILLTPHLALATEPWPEPVCGNLLLDDLARVLTRFAVLPRSAPETLALWILHTYAFQLRDITTYLGLESPEKRCGKTTTLTVLTELVHRPIVAANISSSAFFRVIQELRPTLLIDEADTLLRGNDELRGILNCGYTKKTAFVVRVAPPMADDSELSTPNSSLIRAFSCWCPKIIASIGRLPDTLADRCILIRMQRKTAAEQCERLRNLETTGLKRRCARFVLDHAQAIAAAQPLIPSGLNDRAADIWEPLLALADLAGGHWPESARQAAVALAANPHDTHPIGTLLFDILLVFTRAQTQRIFSRDLLAGLNHFADRSWGELTRGKPITELWLAHQLRPYGIQPRNLRIGDAQAKGYLEDDFADAFRRYIPRSEIAAFKAQWLPTQPSAPKP